MTFLKVTAESEGVTITEIVRRALSVVIVFDEQIKKGRNHIGFASDPSKMDAELLGILTPI